MYSEGAGIFRILPSGVAVPSGREDLALLVKWARDGGTPLIPRGAGSGMPGHNVGAGVVVDLSRGFAADPRIMPTAKLARAEAGVTYADLAVAAGAHNLRLPPDPSSARFCTLGGMVSTNAAGARSLKYGATRAWVAEMEIVSADGEMGVVPSASPASRTAAEQRFIRDVVPGLDDNRRALDARRPFTRKNSSGYALFPQTGERVRDLLVGSEGTLAFVTAVTVRLDVVPNRTMTLLIPLASLEALPQALDQLDQAKPAAIELLDRTYLEFIRALGSDLPPQTEAALLVELEPDGIELLRAGGGAQGAVAAHDAASQARLWGLRHRASPILAGLPDTVRSLQVVEDGCVPRAQLATYISGLREIARRHDFPIVIFGHAGDGHVHANLLADVARPDLVDRLSDVLAAASQLQVALDGTLSGEHGDGRLRAPYLSRLYGDAYVEWCRKVKQAWDPAGIMNPGVKLAAGGGTALDAALLKVGAAAPALPAAVAALLRRIEKEADWDSFRLDLLPESSAQETRA